MTRCPAGATGKGYLNIVVIIVHVVIRRGGSEIALFVHVDLQISCDDHPNSNVKLPAKDQ